jgi:hypothetical protein
MSAQFQRLAGAAVSGMKSYSLILSHSQADSTQSVLGPVDLIAFFGAQGGNGARK